MTLTLVYLSSTRRPQHRFYSVAFAASSMYIGLRHQLDQATLTCMMLIVHAGMYTATSADRD